MKSSRDIFRIVEFLMDALGPDYEAIFYKLDEDGRGTIAARHGEKDTGQNLGQPMPGEIQKLYDEDFFANAYAHTDMTTIYDNGLVANTSMIYFDGTDSIEKGILCINLFENKFFEIIQELMYISNLDKKLPLISNLSTSIKEGLTIHIETNSRNSSDEAQGIRDRMEETIKKVVKKHMGIYANDSAKFSPGIRKAIMTELYQEGVFNIKGINGAVAEALFCSEVSIYRYLSMIKKEN